MYRVLMVVLGLVGVAWGATALIVPNVLAQLYGGELDPFARAFANVGAAIAVGFGLMDWSVRNLQDLAGRRWVLISNLTAVTLVATVLLLSTASGTFNSLGWLGGAAHAALAAVVLVALVRSEAG
jgi:hypothetical protein